MTGQQHVSIPHPDYIAALSRESSKFAVQASALAFLGGLVLGAGVVGLAWWLS